MTVRLVCRSCGKRLKIPDGLAANRTARCPKCSTPVDLTAARAYAPVPLLGSDDPLPYDAAPKTAAAKPPLSQPKPPPPKPTLPSLPTTPPLPKAKGEPAAGPRPTPAKTSPPPAKDEAPKTKHEPPHPDDVLSLDDDPSDGPAEVEPFRVPVNVLADSLTAHVGACVAVLLPHGLFLEHEPMKPFLFVPVGARVSSQGPGELTAILPDGRTVTLRFAVRYARPLARDARAFLAGERPVPAAADYRRKWWMLWAAVMFALGLAGGPLVLSQTAQLGVEFGLKVGGGFALAGLVANMLVVLFSRRPVFVQLVVMAGACVAVTGLFLFGATAYLAGRQRALEEARAEQQQQQPPPAPLPKPPDEKPPDEKRPETPPSHLDIARKRGSSAFDDADADVTALALTPDGRTLAVGHASGATRLWPLDQPTFDPPLPGPTADGPVTRIQFVADGRFVFAHTTTGAVGIPRTAPPVAPAKLPGAPVAIAPALDGDRVRFAAVRGNQLVHRSVRDTFVQAPPGAKGYSTPGKGDETTPAGAPKDGPKPPGANWPTFLAWGPGGKLFAGGPDGTVSAWSGAMRPETSRDHRVAVKAWAACPATGDFATGDDQGRLGVWSAKTGKPSLPLPDVLSTPITGLSFNPSGSRLAVTDTTGWLVIWDVAAAKAVHRVKRPAALKAVALGPGDDTLALAFGRTVEVWSLAELIK